MYWIALKMLTGDRGKYFALVFGVAFSCLLIAEQSATFCGVMMRTIGLIRDIEGVDIWVMNSNTRQVDDVKAISDDAVFRVRSVPGVAWAVNLYRGMGQAQLESGDYQAVILFGVDDASLAGAPPPSRMLLGKPGDLQIPDSVLMDEAGYRYLWPGEPLRTGRLLQMNDRRAVVVGIFRASQTFMTNPVIYTRFSHATLFVPPTRRLTPFVLARCRPDAQLADVTHRIHERTGLLALSKPEFMRMTMGYYLLHTGIPINFGTTVLLGFLIGCAIAGQTFYLFTVENLRQFGTLKAMGLSDRALVTMILLQALLVAGIGYGLGIGVATLFGMFAARLLPLLSFYLPWQVLAITGIAMIFIALLSSVLSIRRVLVLEPAIVFQGG
jgi:putative ABC transport system permease protein